MVVVPLVCPILGFEVKLPTTVLVLQLSSNLVRISNFLSVLNFWKKKSKSFTFWWRHHNFLDKIFGIFYLFFFLEMRTSMFLKHFKHKTKNIKHKTILFFLMTWLDKWQQGRTHIRHILFKFLPNLCYIKKIKVIKFGDKIFNRTKVINKNLEGEVILPPPPPKNRVKWNIYSHSDPQFQDLAAPGQLIIIFNLWNTLQYNNSSATGDHQKGECSCLAIYIQYLWNLLNAHVQPVQSSPMCKILQRSKRDSTSYARKIKYFWIFLIFVSLITPLKCIIIYNLELSGMLVSSVH